MCYNRPIIKKYQGPNHTEAIFKKYIVLGQKWLDLDALLYCWQWAIEDYLHWASWLFCVDAERRMAENKLDKSFIRHLSSHLPSHPPPFHLLPRPPLHLPPLMSHPAHPSAMHTLDTSTQTGSFPWEERAFSHIVLPLTIAAITNILPLLLQIWSSKTRHLLITTKWHQMFNDSRRSCHVFGFFTQEFLRINFVGIVNTFIQDSYLRILCLLWRLRSRWQQSR